MPVINIEQEPCPEGCGSPVLIALDPQGKPGAFEPDITPTWTLISKGTGVLYQTRTYGHVRHECRRKP